jgi:hypothetical protein
VVRALDDACSQFRANDAGRKRDDSVAEQDRERRDELTDGVFGTMSPKPVVVSVTMAQYMLSGMLVKPCWGLPPRTSRAQDHRDDEHGAQEHEDLGGGCSSA